MTDKHIIVIGGGPAGMMAAIRAAGCKAQVTLIEKNDTLGKKLLLTGKGRCNLTNACGLDAFLKQFSKNGDFLRDACKVFFNKELMRFFKTRSVALKTEAQERVFPASDQAETIVHALRSELRARKVKILYNTQLKEILCKNGTVTGVKLKNAAALPCTRVILATGGISYPLTGSTGEGMQIAARLGHTLVPLRPGLLGLDTKEPYPKRLEGLALTNIRLTFTDGKKKVVSEKGELLFTGSGISGPLVVSLSGQIIDWLADSTRVWVEIDTKPTLSYEALDQLLLQEFHTNPTKLIKNILQNIFPHRFVELCLSLAHIAPTVSASRITRTDRTKITEFAKRLKLEITKPLAPEKAMITRGGILLKNINPKTMESRIIKGLYFAGEMMDIDGNTGGFNLQAAFSTGYLAGQSAAEE